MLEVTTYLSTAGIPEIAGILGFVVYMGSFSAVQLGCLSGNSVHFSIANVTAALLVLVSLTSEFNLASALIQVSFAAIGMIGITRRVFRKIPANTSFQ